MNAFALTRTETGALEQGKGVIGQKKLCLDFFDELVEPSTLAQAADNDDDFYGSDVETDSAPSSGTSSLISSSNDGMGAEPIPTEMAEVEVVPRKSRVKFADTVSIREEYYDDSANKYDSVDTVAAMKKAAVSRPTIEPVTFDKKEEEIRSKLVGLIPAQKRRHHDYGRMYGCGPCLSRTDSSRDLDEDYDSEDDSDLDCSKPLEPVRVIHASAPSAMWFSAGFL